MIPASRKKHGLFGRCTMQLRLTSKHHRSAWEAKINRRIKRCTINKLPKVIFCSLQEQQGKRRMHIPLQIRGPMKCSYLHHLFSGYYYRRSSQGLGSTLMQLRLQTPYLKLLEKLDDWVFSSSTRINPISLQYISKQYSPRPHQCLW